MAADRTKYFILCNERRSARTLPVCSKIINVPANTSLLKWWLKESVTSSVRVSRLLSSIRWIWWKTSAPSLSPSSTRDTCTSWTSPGETSSPSLRSWDVRLQWLSIDSGMFLRFRMEQPVYINIIRDPINRFLSNYFFRRFGDWRGEQNHLVRTPRMKDDERYLVRVLLLHLLFFFLCPMCLSLTFSSGLSHWGVSGFTGSSSSLC